MKINLKFMTIEINVTFYQTRKSRVLNELKTKSRIYAVKLHRELYGSGISEATNEISKWYGLSKGQIWHDYFDMNGNPIKKGGVD